MKLNPGLLNALFTSVNHPSRLSQPAYKDKARDASAVRLLVLHQPGAGLYSRAAADLQPPLDRALAIYRSQDVSPHAVLAHDGTLHSVRPLSFKAQHVGGDSRKAYTPLTKAYTPPDWWREQWPQGPGLLADWWRDGSINRVSYGVEIIGESREKGPVTAAQMETIRRLALALEECSGFENRPTCVVTHSDVDPIRRSVRVTKSSYADKREPWDLWREQMPGWPVPGRGYFWRGVTL